MTEKFKILPSLIEALMKEFNEIRQGIHVSSITYCPRKSVFQTVNPIPITMKELNFFTSGKAMHVTLQALMKIFPDIEIEKEIIHNGVLHGTVDAYIPSKNMVIEIKTARVGKMDKVKKTYVDQIKSYMAMVGADHGIIIVQLINHYEDTPFIEFPVFMTESERKEKLKWLDNETMDIAKAMKYKDPSLARHVYDDADKNFLCCNWKQEPNCPYFTECKAMRMKEKEKAKTKGVYYSNVSL